MTGSLMYAFEGDPENLRTQAYWSKNHDRPEPIEHNDLFIEGEKYLSQDQETGEIFAHFYSYKKFKGANKH